MEVLDWLETTPIVFWVRTSEWGVASQLVLHALGMASAVGLILLLSLRVLGFGRRLPIAWFRTIGPILALGFILVTVSGLLLFLANGNGMLGNSAFQLKLLFLVTGSVSLWLLWQNLIGTGSSVADAAFSRNAKLLAAASLVSWLGVIFYGRMIAYSFTFGG